MKHRVRSNNHSSHTRKPSPSIILSSWDHVEKIRPTENQESDRESRKIFPPPLCNIFEPLIHASSFHLENRAKWRSVGRSVGRELLPLSLSLSLSLSLFFLSLDFWDQAHRWIWILALALRGSCGERNGFLFGKEEGCLEVLSSLVCFFGMEIVRDSYATSSVAAVVSFFLSGFSPFSLGRCLERDSRGFFSWWWYSFFF